ncbi:hypothetical protein G7Z17_g6913 [Cylindrodendrum hubeiense]|uniref:Ribosomal protein S19 n=1 Tax=Cylindrodendrum hubeiense TaxID=595255 RepID=A0A9P5LFU4_9HYPO|nr:hypothetical protein G7Z17_g6913 [Cylindrodendrum hubeiense]
MQATRVLFKRSVWKGRPTPCPVSSPNHRTTPSNLDSLPIVWPKNQGDKVPPVRTQARSATILPNFVGLNFEVHNGRDYHHVTITEDMVGHKLGEFSP